MIFNIFVIEQVTTGAICALFILCFLVFLVTDLGRKFCEFLAFSIIGMCAVLLLTACVGAL